MKYLLFFTLIFISKLSFAVCTQTGNIATGLTGMDGTDRTYVRVTSELAQCGCLEFRFLPENSDVDNALSVLLVAKATGRSFRVDIDIDGDCNSAYRVYLE